MSSREESEEIEVSEREGIPSSSEKSKSPSSAVKSSDRSNKRYQ